TAEIIYGRNTSADGRLVVASIGSVYGVLDLTTGVLKPLPYDPNRHQTSPYVVISSDGKRVAYVGRVNGAFDFRVVNVDGSDLRVFRPEAEYDKFLPLDWSRDGRSIAGLAITSQPTADVPRARQSFAIFDVVAGKFHAYDAALTTLESPGTFLRH